jgi:glycosyltransferase involved in cell wall biosynthesis
MSSFLVNPNPMRIALVHDYLIQYGGAERVLESFMEMFPRAPIYTLIYNEKKLGSIFNKRIIRTSFLQKMPFVKTSHHFFPVMMPLAIEQFDFSYYDLVLSDTSSFAKGILTSPQTKHICYCHTPMRFAWDDSHRYTREFYLPRLIKKLVPLGMNYLRMWDKLAAKRVDDFVANSNLVKKRVEKYYKRNSEVIYPPLFFDHFQNLEKDNRFKNKNKKNDYYLMVGRLVPYKKFDLGIKAFNKLKKPLKIVGGGPEFKRLKKIANQNIEFLGSLKSSGKKLIELYKNCRALIYPQEEDFGLVPLESMALGKPVIAFKKGGALETIQEGKTGLFFEHQTVDSIIKKIKLFEKIEKKFEANYIKNYTKKFDRARFKREMENFIERKMR